MTALRTLTLALTALAACAGAQAQTLITQDKALAGGITAGDGAGYPIYITQSGSFKLMSNLVVPSGTTGVHIQAPDVTLDLNGFTISGPVTCDGTLGSAQMCNVPPGVQGAGVIVTAANATVRNGIVRGFGGGGVISYMGGRFFDLALTSNGGAGLAAWFSNQGEFVDAHVERVRVERNGGNGLTLATGSLVINATVRGNGGSGISAGNNYTNQIHDSRIVQNYGSGLNFGSHSIVRGTALSANQGGNIVGAGKSAGGNLNETTVF